MTLPTSAHPPPAARCLLALLAVCGLSCEEAATPPASSPEIITTKSGIEMVLVPPGWFEMGSRNGEPDETPVHRVWVDALLVDRYEMTQEACARLARTDQLLSGDPAHFKGLNRPVEMISWDIGALYCNARSRIEGLEPCYDDQGKCHFEANGYRLPTEAEWEYACRAGTTTPYSFGSAPRLLKDYAWYGNNSARTTHPVGRRKPNPWGLFDMHGNVAEWCNDVYDPDYYKTSPARNPRGAGNGRQYVLRGGAWSSSADVCRSAYRVGEAPGTQDACFAQDAVGFRCVRRPPPDLLGPQGAAGDKGRVALTTGFVYGDIYLKHRTGTGHPERPARLVAIRDRLKDSGVLAHLVALKPRAADERWLTAVHAPEYVARVRQRCRVDAGYVDTMDAPASRESCDVALAAVGGVLAAVDAVVDGKVRNAFCAVRPPGHHARRNRAMGFCLFNNVAVAARYIQKKHGLAKVLIVDWDVHH
ncbi:MAG: SUMF1/EgtB/PvdO family nonheme iron enzyme, partial [Planctomycetota bacterium]|nr:SUMF1/EgtB/PvdO family nonheme iron enzyme [Planctomycetota bacterium]